MNTDIHQPMPKRYQMNKDGDMMDTKMHPKVLAAQVAFAKGDKRRTRSREATPKVHAYTARRDDNG